VKNIAVSRVVQEVHNFKEYCDDVTNGIKADSLQILEKGWGDLHHYLDDRWYEISLVLLATVAVRKIVMGHTC